MSAAAGLGWLIGGNPAPSPLFPLRYARGNLLFGRGDERVALYRLPMSSYPFKAIADKWVEMRRLERLAITIGADFSLWRVQRAYPADRYIAQVDELLDDRHQDPADWRAYLSGHVERFDRDGVTRPRAVPRRVRQRRRPLALWWGLVRATERIRRRVEDLAGIGDPQPVSHSELVALATSEQDVYDRLLTIYGSASRATTSELAVAAQACCVSRRRRASAGWQLDRRRARDPGRHARRPVLPAA